MNETEIRRKMTSVIAENKKESENQNRFKNNIYADVGEYVKKDEINRNIFLEINALITGMTYEYNHYSKTHHPLLEEFKYKYFRKEEEYPRFNEETMTEMEYALKAKDSVNKIIEDEYWDSFVLHQTGLKSSDYIFYWELDEETGEEIISENPYRYSNWNLSSEYIKDYHINEFDLLNNLLYIIDFDNNKNDSFLLINDFIKYSYDSINNSRMFINKELLENDFLFFGDENDFSYGIIKEVTGKKFYYHEFVGKGNYNFSKGTNNITEFKTLLIESILNKLKEININMIRYSKNSKLDNSDVINLYEDVVNYIENFSDYTSTGINDFINNYPKDSIFINDRMTEIDNYLSNNSNKYLERNEIISQRINTSYKGTLADILSRISGIDRAMKERERERENNLKMYNKYFDVYLCKKDGDGYRRVFINKEHTLKKGDFVYLLTDNAEIPEIYAEVDLIVDGRVVDNMDFDYNEKTNEIKYKYIHVNKIFFKNFQVNGKNKKRYVIPNKYKFTDNFRVINQKLPLPKSF